MVRTSDWESGCENSATMTVGMLVNFFVHHLLCLYTKSSHLSEAHQNLLGLGVEEISSTFFKVIVAVMKSRKIFF